MRTNLPVTQREYPFPDDTTLMSTTDLQSHIRYANGAFVALSGFSREELLGQPHNIVRHPDMPREAFADMWATLHDGHSWSALVKNRRKDGDHYWVRANATPIVRGGQVTGYMSVRTKPAADEVKAAQTLYKRFQDGQAKGLRFHRGIVVRAGLASWTSALKTISLAWQLRLGCLLAGVPPLAAAALNATGAAGVAFDMAFAVAGIVAANAFLQWRIGRPIVKVASLAQSVASGQPASNFQMDRVDEIGMLMRAVNQSGLNLRSLLDDVSAQVSGLTTAAGEVAAGNEDLSSRTEQAASSLQETASSMEEMTSVVRQSAESAQAANQIAATAREAAAGGGQLVGQVVSTMEKISASARRIAEINGVIDGIAFQTNILALNAAVEAARAGEQGRGFAVVAAEVRALAQRSSAAAREIKALIGSSVECVDAGSRQVADSGAAMSQIQAQVERVGNLIAEISAASREQSQGIGQVNVAVSQLDQMTQQNAALVEQGAAASASMRVQSTMLGDAVAAFR